MAQSVKCGCAELDSPSFSGQRAHTLAEHLGSVPSTHAPTRQLTPVPGDLMPLYEHCMRIVDRQT